MSLPDRSLSRLKRRWLVGEVLRAAAGWLSCFLLLFGAAVLAVKLFSPRFWPDVLWLGLLILPVAVIVVWRAVQRVPDDRELIALLDRRLGAGGLLMTLSERSDPRWQQRLPEVDSVRNVLPRLRPVRFARVVAVPFLFAVGTGFVPPREDPPPATRYTAGNNAARQLAETFELLEQADALDNETRELLRREVEQLEAETRDMPLTHEKWETVDALRERLRAGLDATQLSIAQGRSAAAALASAAAAGTTLTPERTGQLNEAVRAALETLRKNGALGRQDGHTGSTLSPEMQRLLKSGDFRLPADAESREQTLDALKQLLDSEAQRLAAARGECQQCLGGDGPPGDLFSANRANRSSQQAGRGGVSRGRADAAMTFGDESDEQAAKFKAAVLPPGVLDQPGDTVQSVTASAPQVEPADAAPRNAARDAKAATGQATWNRSLRPRHRDIVRQYFGE